MKTFLTWVACMLQLAAIAQINNTWLGGSPGRETDWHYPRNWSTFKVPDDFRTVTISDVSAGSGSFPIISGNAGNINALELEAGATLTIRAGRSLSVASAESSLVLGTLFNKGRLELAPLPIPMKAAAPETHRPGEKLKSIFASMLQVTVMLDDF